jgi:hypothetical protein
LGVPAAQARLLHLLVASQMTALSKEGTDNMSKPIEKTPIKPLVHLPSSILEDCGSYDASNHIWVEFDLSLTEQIRELEAQNQQYIRVRPQLSRRSLSR